MQRRHLRRTLPKCGILNFMSHLPKSPRPSPMYALYVDAMMAAMPARPWMLLARTSRCCNDIVLVSTRSATDLRAVETLRGWMFGRLSVQLVSTFAENVRSLAYSTTEPRRRSAKLQKYNVQTHRLILAQGALDVNRTARLHALHRLVKRQRQLVAVLDRHAATLQNDHYYG